VIGINGAAAHLMHPGDLVIIIAYGLMDNAEAAAHRPRVIFVDEDNRIVSTGADPAASAAADLASGAETAETADATMLDALLSEH